MVPNGWDKIHLKSLLSTQVKNGYSPNAIEKETGYVVLGLGALTDHRLDTSSIKNVEVTEQVLKSQLCEGDFLISRSNTPDKVGRSVMFRGEIPNCSYPDLMMKFRADESKVDSSYLETFLQSTKTRQYFKNHAAGSSSSMVKINKTIVEKTPVLLPPLPEQRKIAKTLSTWDKAISTTEKLIETSKQQKKALMQLLLTGKKRLVNPDTGEIFAKEWEKTHLKPLLKEEKSRNRDNRITRVLSVTNHSGFVLPEEQFSKRVASDNISNYKVVKKGQFGYNPSRLNVGSFACLNQFSEGVLSPMYVVFSTDATKLQKEYLSYWMQSNEAKQRVKNSTQGSVRESVGFDALCSFPFILPNLDEQNKIISVLSAADKEIEMLEAKLAHFKQEKKALMQQLLTGKRRVKVDNMEAA
ncbi:restriction endonuclease subunit S [Vibrio parahaemolyticus]|uniref:restriction endonuclease subunit S n=1 Tax=Vibrio parahaemolyticus TaxID=670 RepID=UPI00040F2E69|nr:restriction endonuclease subunit S [Vibrio parahaemolyticus]